MLNNFKLAMTGQSSVHLPVVRELVAGENQHKDEHELLPWASFLNDWLRPIQYGKTGHPLSVWEVENYFRNEGGTAMNNRPCYKAGAIFVYKQLMNLNHYFT